MAEEHAAETPPGTPGRRALGAMESAVRRARESAGAPPLSLLLHHHARNARSRRSSRSRRAAEGRPPDGRDRWLVRAVVLVAALVAAAAVALVASLGSSTSPSPTAARSIPTATAPSRSPSAGHGRGATGSTSSGSTSPSLSTSTTAAIAPGGPPVISSLSPSSGAAGQIVLVAGANFLSSGGQIVATFNGEVAPTSCPAQNTCMVTVPSSTAPSAQVVITTSSGPSNALTFTYG